MSEKDLHFDRQMIEGLSEAAPPDEEIRRTNPWSMPLDRIIGGLILTTLHLNFLYLQYLLPTIGTVLIFLGFRSLRNENSYFKTLWLFSIIKLFVQLASLVWLSTPLHISNYPELTIGFVMQVYQIAMFLLFHAALKETFKKAGKSMGETPLVWAALWTAAAFLVALSPLAGSWRVFIPMIACYIFIIRLLYRIEGQLADTGYLLINAPVRINGRTFGKAYCLTALILVLVCNSFYNHLSLEPREYQAPQITEARQRLLELTFPAEALQCLSDEDVMMLSEAVNVEAFSKQLMFDPKKIESREMELGAIYITHTYEPGQKNMEVTTIYAEMPENRVYVMQYFTWQGGKPVWQDGFLISDGTGTEAKEIISSGLFYSKKGARYKADFPRLTCEPIIRNTMFGSYRSTPITAAISYPFGAEEQRGYVLYRYTVMADSDVYSTYSLFTYIHRTNPLRIPYARTEDLILKGAYVIEDELQQHYTNYESLALKKVEENGD